MQADNEARPTEYQPRDPLKDGAINSPGFGKPSTVPSLADENSPIPEGATWPTWVKVWPLVVFGTIRGKNTGAARIWFLAKVLDPMGSGWVLRSVLFAYLKSLAVGGRKRRRWLTEAISLGLLTPGRTKAGQETYSIASLAQGSIILGCAKVGRPASIPAGAFASPGWRPFVWDAYNTTLNGPVSQKRKAAITGIHPRVQRYYQVELSAETVQNYAPTKHKKEHVEGLCEVTGNHYFFNKKNRQVIQRLPDIRVVPLVIAKREPKGRSRKAQRVINSQGLGETQSSFERQAKGAKVRLFNLTPKQTKATIRRLRDGEIPPWEAPAEIFQHQTAKTRANLWTPFSLELLNA